MNNMRKIRIEKNLTQTTLGKLSGVDHSMISRVERGERKPSLDTAAKIAKALGCKVDDLIE